MPGTSQAREGARSTGGKLGNSGGTGVKLGNSGGSSVSDGGNGINNAGGSGSNDQRGRNVNGGQ